MTAQKPSKNISDVSSFQVKILLTKTQAADSSMESTLWSLPVPFQQLRGCHHCYGSTGMATATHHPHFSTRPRIALHTAAKTPFD